MEREKFEKILKFITNFKIPLALAFLGLIFVSFGLISPKLTQTKDKDLVVVNSSSSPTSKIKVDVSGAVKNPGVFSLEKDSRVQDAITAAGGFAPNADQIQVAKNINLAAKIGDGQKIYIAFLGENQVSSNEASATALVNINSATLAELDSLPGVGMVTANKIVAARPYQKLSDLTDKKVVGSSLFEKIKDLISVY